MNAFSHSSKHLVCFPQAAEAGGTCMGQSRAGAPGMEARHLHLAARRCCPPSSQHGQPRAHRTQARATVWIRYAPLQELQYRQA